MSQPTPSSSNRITFSVNEALASAFDDIERAGVLIGIPPPMKRIIRLAFEESIYALADYGQKMGDVPPDFRFEVIPANPRSEIAEREIALINDVLDKARKLAETS